MSSYTMQLKTIIEQPSQYEEGLSIREKIEIGRKKLFDFYYPIYDEDFRKIFETNLIRKFYMREIGFETEELFKFQLETWLNINMPYYNRLFESELIEYDPLSNTRMDTKRKTALDRQHDGKNDTRLDKQINVKQDNVRDLKDEVKGNQSSTTDGESISNMNQDSTSSNQKSEDNFGRKVGSDNPDSRLQLTTQDGKGVIEYASNIDENKVNNKANTSGEANTTTDSTDSSHMTTTGEQKQTSTSNEKVGAATDEKEHFDRKNNIENKINEMEDYVEHRFGKIGVDSYPKMIQEFRSAILRVEVQIHKELQQLFMLVY